MKTWIKRSLIGLTSITVLFAGLSACGHKDHGRGWSDERVADMRGKAVERISDKLTLSTEQKTKLGVLADEMVAARKAMSVAGAGTDPRAELQGLIAGATFDRSKAQQMLGQKLQTAQGSGPKLVVAFGDFFDSLSAEQQKVVRERMASSGRGWWGRG